MEGDPNTTFTDDSTAYLPVPPAPEKPIGEVVEDAAHNITSAIRESQKESRYMVDSMGRTLTPLFEELKPVTPRHRDLNPVNPTQDYFGTRVPGEASGDEVNEMSLDQLKREARLNPDAESLLVETVVESITTQVESMAKQRDRGDWTRTTRPELRDLNRLDDALIPEALDAMRNVLTKFDANKIDATFAADTLAQLVSMSNDNELTPDAWEEVHTDIQRESDKNTATSFIRPIESRLDSARMQQIEGFLEGLGGLADSTSTIQKAFEVDDLVSTVRGFWSGLKTIQGSMETFTSSFFQKRVLKEEPDLARWTANDPEFSTLGAGGELAKSTAEEAAGYITDTKDVVTRPFKRLLGRDGGSQDPDSKQRAIKEITELREINRNLTGLEKLQMEANELTIREHQDEEADEAAAKFDGDGGDEWWAGPVTNRESDRRGGDNDDGMGGVNVSYFGGLGKLGKMKGLSKVGPALAGAARLLPVFATKLGIAVGAVAIVGLSLFSFARMVKARHEALHAWGDALKGHLDVKRQKKEWGERGDIVAELDAENGEEDTGANLVSVKMLEKQGLNREQIKERLTEIDGMKAGMEEKGLSDGAFRADQIIKGSAEGKTEEEMITKMNRMQEMKAHALEKIRTARMPRENKEKEAPAPQEGMPKAPVSTGGGGVASTGRPLITEVANLELAMLNKALMS